MTAYNMATCCPRIVYGDLLMRTCGVDPPQVRFYIKGVRVKDTEGWEALEKCRQQEYPNLLPRHLRYRLGKSLSKNRRIQPYSVDVFNEFLTLKSKEHDLDLELLCNDALESEYVQDAFRNASMCIVARFRNKITGVLVANLETDDKHRPYLFVSVLCTSPMLRTKHRIRGKQLMHEAMLQAKTMGCVYMSLHALKEAVPYYRKLGFRLCFSVDNRRAFARTYVSRRVKSNNDAGFSYNECDLCTRQKRTGEYGYCMVKDLRA